MTSWEETVASPVMLEGVTGVDCAAVTLLINGAQDLLREKLIHKLLSQEVLGSIGEEGNSYMQ